MSDTTVPEAYRAITILLEENDRLVKAQEALLLSNQSLGDRNRDLLRRLGRVSEVFGEGISTGGESLKPDTGPKRPNRQKLSDREVKDIRQAYQGGMKQVDLASNYGVNPSTISRTVRGFYN